MKSQAPNSKSQTNSKFKTKNSKQIQKTKISKSSNPQIPKSFNPLTVFPSSRPTVLPSYSLTVLIFLLLSASLFAQNEANIWYFGVHCGIDFNSGMPVALYDGKTSSQAPATISDSSGNLLFYTDEYHIYDNHHNRMMNDSVIAGIGAGVSGRAIVKWPGQKDLYFVFTATYSNYNDYHGFYYSLVDLKENNGSGAVTSIYRIEEGWDVADRIAIVKKENTDNVWVVVRKFADDAMAVFLVDESGFHPDPVISPMPDRINESGGDWGYIKISYDKKYLVSSYQVGGELEVCRFNAINGEVEYLYTHNPGGIIHGIEFSPDSKLFYYSGKISNDTTVDWIYQLDMQYIEDEALFYNSAILVGSHEAVGVLGIQLARDGKIYLSGDVGEDEPDYYINVIHDPWIRGVGCSYERHSLLMFPGYNAFSLPNILLDHLYRFEWEADNYCQSDPVHFLPNFIPTPDSIRWFFDEFAPGNYSNDLSPTYTFQFPGIHEIEVDVWYPSGRYEHTSRELEIFPNPEPDLGPDTSICEDNTLVLYANCPADMYAWSTGQFGVSSITIADSGLYWVRAAFTEGGCETYDTIHVGFHPQTTIDETNLLITPTTCNGASGSITGLTALGSMPFAYQWLDLSGNDYGNSLDLYNLAAGQYILTVTDGNGCQTSSAAYTIEDAGNLQVLDVEVTQPHCGMPDGQIVVHAFSPSGSVLEYSVDDGTNYSSDSIFSGLLAGVYVVRIRDSNGCEGFYVENPIMMVDIPGPQVTQVNVTNETDFLGNGAIEIIASGSTPEIYYSIDSGATWQLNDGSFYNLQSRIYSLQVKDDNGCDTTFTVEIQNIILTYLHAITGEGGHCLGKTALVPVNVDNFNSVASFHLKLGYNKDNLQCEGFANVHPQLADSLTGWVDLAGGNVHLAWNGELPLTFSQQEKVADLVFTTKNPGQGQLSWYTGETESYFTNAGGNPIPAEFSTGEVTIYEPPQIILAQSKTACEGEDVYIMSIASGNQPPIDYLWIYPNGDTTTNDPMYFSVSQADGGIYTLLATDQVGCTDQKSIELIVSQYPVAAFHGTDTMVMHAGDLLDAGEGMAYYEWNTGDTTQSIGIQAEGMYSVEMESQAGCLGHDSICIKLTSDEIPDFEIYIPNAFSPNGDGLNDRFQIIIPNSTFKIQHSTLLIFDRWGGQIFESDDIMTGWDGTKHGKALPAGIYTYKITYSIYPSLGDYTEQVKLGTVMLVR